MKHFLWVLPLCAIAGCGSHTTDFDAIPPNATLQIASFDTDPPPYKTLLMPIKDAQKVASLITFANENRQDWRDMGSANNTTFTGIELRFKWNGGERAVTVFPNGFSSSYGNNDGNLTSFGKASGQSKPYIVIKEITDAQMQTLLQTIGPVPGDLAPKGVAVPRGTVIPAPTPSS